MLIPVIIAIAIAILLGFFFLLRRKTPRARFARSAGDDIRFTAYRPAAMVPERWYKMLVFAHRTEARPDAAANTPSPAEQVRREAARLLGPDAASFVVSTEDSAAPVPREAELTIVPDLPGVQFNPVRLSIGWHEDVHSVEFRMKADNALDGTTARGRLSIFCGPVLLAELSLVIRVSADAGADQQVADSFTPYRKVFASYSRRDDAIVRQLEIYARAFGDQYLRDVTALRAGEKWDSRISRLIEEADVFQLFWSWNSIQSEYVSSEWQHALSLGRPGFVRPVYWEDPLPAKPELNLPPPELRAIHFQQLPLFTVQPSDPTIAPPVRLPTVPPPPLPAEPQPTGFGSIQLRQRRPEATRDSPTVPLPVQRPPVNLEHGQQPGPPPPETMPRPSSQFDIDFPPSARHRAPARLSRAPLPRWALVGCAAIVILIVMAIVLFVVMN